MKKSSFPACLLVALVCTSPALSAEAILIDDFGDWSAYTVAEGGNKVCYIGGLPDKSEGKYSARGDTHTLVTHRPAEKAVNVVSIRAGYTYGKESEVEVAIDDATFQLFTDEGHAFAWDSRADAALVKAMMAGTKMIVRGTSSRGTRTVDTYSLKGFTAAYRAIGKACGVN
jgi:hypothetical protein